MPGNIATNFTELDTLQDSGVCAKITSRVDPNGQTQYSFQLYRPYEKNGERKETTWMSRRHLPAVLRLLDEVNSRILQERAEASRERFSG